MFYDICLRLLIYTHFRESQQKPENIVNFPYIPIPNITMISSNHFEASIY